MYSKVKNSLSSCWKPVQRYTRMNRDDDDNSNIASSSNPQPLLWSIALEKHFLGEFSFAVIKSNPIIEDESQVEVGRNATFVGIYDGHGGFEAARYVLDHLFESFISIANENTIVPDQVIRDAIAATEEGFLNLVSLTRHARPTVVAIGACCLVGLIWRDTLCVANLGDSRAVIGTLGPTKNIVAEQLNEEHNAARQEVRQQLMDDHPEDPLVVEWKNGAWRVKGLIQISRSIGDAYLKIPGYQLGSTYERFHCKEITRPILSAEPSVYTRVLNSNDKFLIFASDGLWEHLENQDAVELVHKSPRMGIAQRLLKKALKRAAAAGNKRYKELLDVKLEDRRSYHDDISVVVIYLDYNLLNEGTSVPILESSFKGYIGNSGLSKFNLLHPPADNLN